MCYSSSLPKTSRRAEKKVIFLFVELYILFTWAYRQVKFHINTDYGKRLSVASQVFFPRNDSKAE